MVSKLLARLKNENHEVVNYVTETDSFGRTALQMASRGGHLDIVEVLVHTLTGKWDTIKERDVNGNT